MTENMMQWLQTFPQWQGSLHLDQLDGVPGSAGLYPKGITEISRREDVLGNVQARCQCEFILRIATAGEQAKWLLDFQNWVAEQDRLGLAPKFGDDPKSEFIRAFDGQLHSHQQTGSSVYTVVIRAEFTKIYRGE